MDNYKLVLLKTWEIEFLNECNPMMGMSLRDTMTAIKHLATNPCFLLFHSIDQQWKDNCYIITMSKVGRLLGSCYDHSPTPLLEMDIGIETQQSCHTQIPK